MKNTLMLFLLTICFPFCSLFAGENQGHRLGFQFGLAHFGLRDRLVSPLMHEGYRFPVEGYYFYQGEKSRHAARLFYNSGEIRSPAGNSAREFTAGFTYQYHRMIPSFFNPAGRMYIGGAWQNYFLERNYAFQSPAPGRNTYTDTQTWELVSSLNLSFLWEYDPWPERKLSAQLTMPLLAAVLRPSRGLALPEDILMLENPGISDILGSMDIVTMNRYFFAELMLSLETAVSARLHFRWNYLLGYYRLTIPLESRALLNEITMDFIIIL